MRAFLLVPVALLGSLLVAAGAAAETFEPGFDVTPGEVAQTGTVVASGQGWGDVSSVEIWWADPAGNDVPLAQVPVVDGAFESAAILVSVLDPGTHRLYACSDCPSPYDDVSGPVVWDSLVVLRPPPSVVADPVSGVPGSSVSLSGLGWTPGSLVVLSATDVSGAPVDVEDVVADASGAIRTTVVLAGAPGAFRVDACEDCAGKRPRTAATSVEVLKAPVTPTPTPGPPAPTLRVEPGGAEPGALVTVTGRGWGPREEILVFGPGADVGDPAQALGRGRAGPLGGIRVAVEVPAEDPGTLELLACQRCVTARAHPTATARLQVLPVRTTPEPTSAPWWPWLATGALVGAVGTALLLRRPGRRSRRERVRRHPDPTLRPVDAPLVSVGHHDLPAPTLSWRVRDDELVSLDKEQP